MRSSATSSGKVQVLSSKVGIGTLNHEWAVWPPSRSNAAIPDPATASAISPLDLTECRIWNKGKFCQFLQDHRWSTPLMFWCCRHGEQRHMLVVGLNWVDEPMLISLYCVVCGMTILWWWGSWPRLDWGPGKEVYQSLIDFFQVVATCVVYRPTLYLHVDLHTVWCKTVSMIWSVLYFFVSSN